MAKAKRARTVFTKVAANRICEELAQGNSLRTICSAEDMPAASTVYKWLTQHDKFAEQYARAREAQADTLADEILDIADDGERDTYTDDDGFERTNHDVIARSRLRVDARKWMAGKLRPKKYGDKIDVDAKMTHEAGDSLLALMSNIDGKTRSK